MNDLVSMYDTSIGNLNRTKNIDRFLNNFSFKLYKEEYINLKCQNGISNNDYENKKNLVDIFDQKYET